MIESIGSFLSADISGTLVQLFFAFTVILMICDTQKPPLGTGILTGLALILLGIGGSFRAELPAILSVLNGCLWFVLVWQRFSQAKG
jgi:hypothetical protein